MRADRIAFAGVVTVLVAWSLGPAVWQLLTALKPDNQIARYPVVYLPRPATLEHFFALWSRKPFGAYLLNSALVALGATAICLAAAFPGAAALARMAGRTRDAVLLLLLGLALFPPVLLLFPLYEGVRALGWINRPEGLVLPYAAFNLPLAVWVLESAFRSLPRELDEAGRLDGLSVVGRIRRIQAPLVAPSAATAAILVFVFSWNEFMLALTFLTRDTSKTVTAGIASVGGASLYEIAWGQLSAATVFATVPLVVLVLFFQRRIVSGLTRGGVKG
ncbi:MAG: carbohydrate ABC transporter permease [Candidatus Eiseniibacteriota bacterium]